MTIAVKVALNLNKTNQPINGVMIVIKSQFIPRTSKHHFGDGYVG